MTPNQTNENPLKTLGLSTVVLSQIQKESDYDALNQFAESASAQLREIPEHVRVFLEATAKLAFACPGIEFGGSNGAKQLVDKTVSDYLNGVAGSSPSTKPTKGLEAHLETVDAKNELGSKNLYLNAAYRMACEGYREPMEESLRQANASGQKDSPLVKIIVSALVDKKLQQASQFIEKLRNGELPGKDANAAVRVWTGYINDVCKAARDYRSLNVLQGIPAVRLQQLMYDLSPAIGEGAVKAKAKGNHGFENLALLIEMYALSGSRTVGKC